MSGLQPIVDHCRKLVLEPDYRRRYLQSKERDCSGIIGYFSNYIPAEIIAAAGFHPLRLIGNFSAANGHLLPQPMCSLVQDVFAAASAGQFSFLKTVIFPNSCDSLKALHQAWQYAVSSVPCYVLRHPVNTNTDAVFYFSAQLKELARELENMSGSVVSQARLKSVIEDYNGIRALQRRLYDQRRDHRLQLGYADLLAAMTAGLIMDRAEYAALLKNITALGQCPPVERKNKRILIVGPLVDHLDLVEKIEMLGVDIIGDSVTNGYRCCRGDIELGADLYESMARHVLRSAPSPTLYANADGFEEMIKQMEPNGVVFINQQCCEPHVHNYLEKSRLLEQKNVKSLMVEVQHGSRDVSEHDMLRIETFIELLTR